MQWCRNVQLSIIAVIAMMGCVAPQSVEMEAVNPRAWREPSIILFENEDTLSLRRLSVALRYNHDFQHDTLAVRINVSLPDAGQFSERVVLRLRRNGTQAPVATSESVPYREHSLLAQKGNYIFTISPESPVRGIEAVGVVVEREEIE